ncbi:polyamine-modulated factor 1 isoform X2 [Narcine bancroftii]|uniref:polyamine-modulated factor 1 isoform X2 n=1 Tax=Narcine bancroftii TaxID=1343680 RepID=UPI0038319211
MESAAAEPNAEEAAGETEAPAGEARAGEAPGPVDESEGSKRLNLFSVTMEQAVEKLLKGASFKRFAECYKPVHEILPQFTHSVHKQLVFQLQTSIREGIRQISEDGLFERALPKLDQLERESEARTVPAWRPTGSPAKDLRPHLVPCYLQQREYLQLKLKKAEAENAALAQDVLQGRKHIQTLEQLQNDQSHVWQHRHRICRQFKQSLQ